MDLSNRLWPALHEFSVHYLDKGSSCQERADGIAAEFLAMSVADREEVLTDLWPLANNLADLYTVLLSLHRKAEFRERTPGKAG